MFLKWFSGATWMLAGATVMFWLVTAFGSSESTGFLARILAHDPDLSRYDFVSILLMVVTVVLAALGLILAVFAVYTITAIKDDAKAQVQKEVNLQIPLIKSELMRDLAEISGLTRGGGELESGFDPQDRGDQ